MPTTTFEPPGLNAPRRPRRKELRDLQYSLGMVAEGAARLPAPYIAEFHQSLLQAQVELSHALERWLLNAQDGDLRFTAQKLRVAMLQINRVIEVLGEKLSVEMEGTLRAAAQRAGIVSFDHLHQQVARMGAVFGESLRPIQLNQAAIAAQARHQLIPTFRNSANRYGSNVAGDMRTHMELIRRELSVGIVRGETFHELTNRLVAFGGPRGWVSLRGTLGEPGSIAEFIPEGLFRRYRPWAARVVRTESLHAYNVHHQAGLEALAEEDPGYMKRWDATWDRNICDVCKRLDGTAVAVTENFPYIRRPHPPAHPNCLCAVTPWRKEWEEDKEGAKPAPTTPPPPAPAPAPAPPSASSPAPAPAQPRTARQRQAPASVQRPGVHPNVIPPSARNDADRAAADKRLAEFTGGKARFEELSHAFAPPDGFKLRVHSYYDSAGKVTFGGDLETDDGDRIGTLTRHFRVEGGRLVVDHSFLKVNDKYQGSGIGGHIFDNSMAAYDKWGVDAVDVDAHWVGRYVWATKGFVPDDRSRGRLRQSLEVYMERHGAPASAIAERLAAFDNSTLAEVARWDIGRSFPNEYRERKPHDPTEFHFGKAFLLSPEVAPWSGRLVLRSARKK